MVERLLNQVLKDRWNSGKVLVLLGPRQVGKTTLLKSLCAEQGSYLYLNADDPVVAGQLANVGEGQLRRIIGSNTTVLIDEAQRVANIGLTLKIIHDQIPEIRLLVSGSSALELANSINEPLTGRKWEYQLYPISYKEWAQWAGYLATLQQFETRLIFGMYPETINRPGQEKEVLAELAGSYLYKDLLNYGGIRKPELLGKILQALALQVGHEVNYNEISNLVGADRSTIEQYVGLLEKAFVIFRLNPLSRNLRNEINTTRKIYFYDNGIRNAVIGQFQTVNLRQDIGALWENFCISERMKANAYAGRNTLRYFWRSYQQQEVDYIEEANGEMQAYEFKWNPKAKGRISKTFSEAYKPTATKIITRDNFFEWLQ
jgi:predicted AAA+ superfamily ATPase